MLDYRKHMKIHPERITGPLLFYFTGTVQQLRDYIGWCKTQEVLTKKESP